MRALKLNLITLLVLLLTVNIVLGNETIPKEAKEKKNKNSEQQFSTRIETNRFLKDWSLTLHGGATTPFTDIRSYDWFRQFKAPSEVQWGAGVGLTKMMGNVFGINLDYTLGKLLGRTVTKGGFAEDRTYWKTLGFDQEVYFKTELFHQASVNMYINWSNLIFGTNRWIKSNIKQKPWKERRVSLYTKMGVGFVRTESNIYNTADDLPINNSKYLRGFTNKFTEIIFPMALGLKFKVSKSFDVGLEGQFVFTNSDKLDAFNFSSAGGIQSLAKMNRDAYAYMNLNVTYKFGRIGAQKEHIEWVNPVEAYMSVVDEKLKNQYKVKDADGDGVIDELDQEPDTEEGAIVDTHGVTLDSDKDGYPDHKDPEPFSTPMLPIEKGINVRPDGLTPQQIQEVKNLIQNEIKTETLDGWNISMIFFDLDKYNIRTSEIPELYKVASVMQKYPNLKLNVKGYTDVRDTDDYNMKLSQNRVTSAIDYLVKTFNIDSNRFVPSYFGETDNLYPDAKTEAQHQLNRRVEFYPVE